MMLVVMVYADSSNPFLEWAGDDTSAARPSVFKYLLRTYPGRSYVAHVEPVDRPAIVPLDQEVGDGLLVSRDDGWRMPDWLWERIEPLLPPPPSHPLGCHRPRVPNRDAMDAIFLVLRTGMQWNALDATGVCSSSSAHRRFQEWERAGVFPEIWRQGLLDYDKRSGSTGRGWPPTAR